MTIIPSELSKLEKFYFRYAWDLKGIADGDIFIKPIERENGRFGISIELGENTTARQLRDAVPLAMQWQKRLNEFQGRGIPNSPLVLQIVDLLESRKAKSHTYAQIADKANRLISENLREYSAMKDKDTFKARLLFWHVEEMLISLHAGQEDLSRPSKKQGRYFKPGRNSKHEEEARRRLIADAIKQGEIDNIVTPQNIKDTVLEWQRKNKRRKT